MMTTAIFFSLFGFFLGIAASWWLYNYFAHCALRDAWQMMRPLRIFKNGFFLLRYDELELLGGLTRWQRVRRSLMQVSNIR